jgi:hypothetical protein
MASIAHHLPALDGIVARLGGESWIWVRTVEPIAADGGTRLRVLEPSGEWEALPPSEKYQRWPGYTFAVFGRRVAAPARDGDDWPCYRLEMGTGSEVIIEGWYWMAVRGGSPFRADITWTPDGGIVKTIREAVPAWHDEWRNRDLVDAGEAMRLLHFMQGGRPGRKAGKRDVSYTEIQTTFWQWVADHDGERPSQPEISERLATSEDTIYRVCRDDPRGWPPPEPTS